MGDILDKYELDAMLFCNKNSQMHIYQENDTLFRLPQLNYLKFLVAIFTQIEIKNR